MEVLSLKYMNQIFVTYFKVDKSNCYCESVMQIFAISVLSMKKMKLLSHFSGFVYFSFSFFIYKLEKTHFINNIHHLVILDMRERQESSST